MAADDNAADLVCSSTTTTSDTAAVSNGQPSSFAAEPIKIASFADLTNLEEKAVQLELPVRKLKPNANQLMRQHQLKENGNAPNVDYISQGYVDNARIENAGNHSLQNALNQPFPEYTLSEDINMTSARDDQEESTSVLYRDHVCTILKDALQLGRFADVTVSVTGSRKKIRCHSAVLAASSPLLREILEGSKDDIQLCDVTYEDAMDLLNMIYVGRVEMEKERIPHLVELATSLFGMTGNFVCEEVRPTSKRKVKRKIREKKIYPKVERPLVSKCPPPTPPVILVLPQDIPTDLLTSSDNPAGTSNQADNLTHYMQCKLKDPVRFKCDQCNRGFPTPCTLARHRKSHTKEGSVYCKVCNKRFSRESTLNTHMFNKHIEEKVNIMQRKKEELLRRRREIKQMKKEGTTRMRSTEDKPAKKDETGFDRSKEVPILNLEDLSSQMSFHLPGYTSESCLDAGSGNLMDYLTSAAPDNDSLT